MIYPEFVYDHIKREYPRKNQWIQEIVDLEKAGKVAEAKQVKQNKANHPYQIALKDYHDKERAFKETLKGQVETYKASLKSNTQVYKNMQVDFFIAEKEAEFYRDYVDLTYDAELKYRNAEVQVTHMPFTLTTYAEDYANFNEAQKRGVSEKEETDFRDKIFNPYKEERTAHKDRLDAALKEKFDNGSISKSAYKNGLKENKLRYQTEIKSKEAEGPTAAQKDAVRHYKHRLKHDVEINTKILNEEKAEVRRTTPIEVEDRRAYLPFITAPIPGLGQALNKQWIKAGLFFLGALFIYFVALPYMLGYGNYQGNGIAGLINLAEGGRRLDRSIIFMIEGIIAIILGLFAVGILLVSFLDVRKVEKDKFIGIRPSNGFEVRNKVQRDGFPYLVNAPALVLIAFIVLVPIITSILLSFTNMDPDHQSKFTWIGIDNYMMIARGEGLAGSLFWKILGWTIIWTLLATTLQILVGFALALLSNNERIKGKKFFRTIYILPWAVPAFITIMFFSILLAQGGFLTQLISSIANRPIDIKNNQFLTKVAIILIQGWLGSSYIFLLTTGVLQSIPSDLYEAADIDGASGWQALTRITVPLVLFQISPLLISQYTFNFNNYSIIALFNDGGPFNPSEYGNLAGSSDILVSYIFKLVTQNQYQAMGSAITIIISLGLMLITFLGYRRSAAFKEG